MSNLTSNVNGEASISSNTRNDSSSTTTNIMLHPQPSSSSSFASEAPPSKKKRSLPSNPDPDAEVIALSPKSLMATNRFMCEICNKGFQRDQNLQLHRRGHNLPWKLKQRNNNEPIRKKVYICPEPSCAHHDPSRALGDLTGIKKHYCRKYGEKKWKCDKCSKKYAVQSDWKAHSKICGTREYRCDCGTIFTRRDSFITHRAFCDALAEESARTINPISTLLPSLPQLVGESSTCLPHLSSNPYHYSLPLKREQHEQHHLTPPWLACELQSQMGQGHGSQMMDHGGHMLWYQQYGHQISLDPHSSHPTLSPQMSATALLQKATAIGVAMNSNNQQQQSYLSHGGMVNNHILLPPPHYHHQHEQQVLLTSNNNTTFLQGSMPQSSMLNNDMLIMSHHHGMGIDSKPPPAPPLNGGKTSGGGGSSNGGGGDGLTRDFLGLKTFSHNKDFLNMELLEQMSSSSTSYTQLQHEDHQGQTPW